MRWWFLFDDRITNIKATLRDIDIAKMAHQHGDWTHAHCHCNGGGEEEEEQQQK